MTPTLIDQLKLAIQVESGEVDWREIQIHNRLHSIKDRWESVILTSKDGCKPVWDFYTYEYRRKPKPLERWMNLDSGGVEEFFKSEEVAKRNADMRTKMTEDTGLGYAITRIAVHMREVTE